MTIDLPEDLERSIRAEIHSGHFGSVDELVAQAVRCFLLQPQSHRSQPVATLDDHDPVIGSMRDSADLMDEIVADAYRKRREDKGRGVAVE